MIAHRIIALDQLPARRGKILQDVYKRQEMWTEFIPSVRRLELFLFPRMQALSEVAWSPKEKGDFKSFLARWEQFKPILDAFGVNYAENRVALAKNLIRRINSQILFQYGNPSYELDWNDPVSYTHLW